jgi:hypothetical protein
VHDLEAATQPVRADEVIAAANVRFWRKAGIGQGCNDFRS